MSRRGEVIPDALLAHLAPLGWQHINLTGDYLWNAGSTFGPDGFQAVARYVPRPARSGSMSMFPVRPAYRAILPVSTLPISRDWEVKPRVRHDHDHGA